jgi:SAM-dependent methyltransferase
MTRPLVTDATTRFSVRVADYVTYRPGYPAEVADHLKREIGLDPTWVIADVGAGTGISARVFLAAGCHVIGVEPNREMREAMVALLGEERKFHAIDGTAEATGLAARSVDVVTCAQAFHWFDVEAAQKEFGRILTSRNGGGWVVLMWNDRDRAQALLREYDELLVRYCPDYGKVRHDRVPEERVREFFGDNVELAEFANRQEFDLPGLRGRLMSSSYAPLEGEPNYRPMMDGLRELFDRHQVAGRVTFSYRTRLFYGRIGV